MTTTTTVPAPPTTPRATRPTSRPIPTTRLVKIELRKMFDTRSGFWMLMSIGLLAVLATVAVIIFAPDRAMTYEPFATAVGFPMAIILPMIAILSVTSEWSQRSGLTSFTLVPQRDRVIVAKAIATVVVGVVSIPLALAVGALGYVVGAAINGTAQVWDMGVERMVLIVLANVLGMAFGFMLGVVIRNSAGAIVGYFVYSLALPPILLLLAEFQGWFADLQPWVDFNYAQTALFGPSVHAEQWGNLATASLIWLVLPLTVGLFLLRRSEVK